LTFTEIEKPDWELSKNNRSFY